MSFVLVRAVITGSSREKKKEKTWKQDIIIIIITNTHTTITIIAVETVESAVAGAVQAVVGEYRKTWGLSE